MREPQKIDVKSNPRAIRTGDIVGFNSFPTASAGQVRGSSGLKTADFSASDIGPPFRGFVLDVVYDPQHNDRITGLVVLPFAPCRKDQRLKNDDKNLLILSEKQLRYSGLSKQLNWRINYTPVSLPITPKNFGYADDGVLKMGHASHDLTDVIMGQVNKLIVLGKFNVMGVLPPSLSRQLRGKQVGDYHNVIGSEARVAFYGNTKEAEALAKAEAQKAADAKAAKKMEKSEMARAMREEMRATPSGRVAFSLGSRFKEAANPDISIAKAYDMDLIDEDTFLFLDEMSHKTLRTAYDAFNGQHAEVLKEIKQLDLTDKDEIESFKAGLEVKIKEALTGFYKALQSPQSEQAQTLTPHVIPYVPIVQQP